MSLIGALTKAAKAGEAAKKTAPFYSAVDEALANIARPKGTGAEFLTELSKQPGVKKAELADRKLEQAFKAKGKITKEEAQQILKENPPPKLKEKVLDESQVLEEDELKDLISQEMFGKPYDEVYNQGQLSRVFDEAMRRMDEGNGPVYGDYRTPGGQNYREILLKLPVFNKTDARRIMELEANLRRGELPTNEMQELVALQAKKESFGTPYYSSHWKEDPNVLAHMRVQDRTGPNGEKILHVEEIQSDWHQAGRKKGYNKERILPDTSGWSAEKTEFGWTVKDANGRILDTEMPAIDAQHAISKTARIESIPPVNTGVPDAPFKKNWHELAMKRLLNYAADKGYDSIAITPGAEQAKRYDLSKQISRVVYSPETEMLNAFDHNDKSVVMRSGVKPDQVADYIGKEPAQRLFDQQNTKLDYKGGKDVPYQEISGVDLQVGGEGMKGFYDKILPDYLNSYGKPYGAQVQQLQIPVKHELQGLRNMGGYPEEPPLTMHNFPITPEMRESIKQKGLPLYQQIGIPTAGAGAASQMPEPEEGLAGGGVVNSLAKTEALAKLAKLREQMAPRAEAVQNLMKMDENRYLRDVVPNTLTNPEIEAEIARMKARAEASQPEVKKADGGAINYNTAPDMSDGGRIIQGAPFKHGGKVKVTTNRDAMFMELSNKKLKRK